MLLAHLLAHLRTHVLGRPRTCISLSAGTCRLFQRPWGKITHTLCKMTGKLKDRKVGKAGRRDLPRDTRLFGDLPVSALWF